MQNFITIRLGIFDPRIGEIVFIGLLFFVFSVCGFFRQASAETVAPILTINTSNHITWRRSAQGCPFGGLINDAPHLGVQIPPKPPQKGRE